MTVVGSAEVELRGDATQFHFAMRQAARQFESVGQSMVNVGAMLTRSLSLPLAGIGAGAMWAGVKMDTLTRSLTAMAGSAQETERQLAELREVAKLPGLGFAEAVEGSVRLQAVGMSAATAVRSLKAFGNAIAITGGGKSELARVTIQLGQLAAKGKILQQDLRPIIEAAPAVGKALRDAFGTIDPTEIEALGLSTDQFLDRLLTQLEKLPAVTGGPKNAIENLQDALLRAGDAIAKTFLPIVEKLVNKFAGMLEKVSKLNPEVVQWAVAIGAALIVIGPLISMVGGLATAISALATALSVGMLPLLATGGVLFVGLGALIALFVKLKLGAENAAPKVMSLADALGVVKNKASGTDAILDAMDTLIAQRAKLQARPLLDKDTQRQIAAITMSLEELQQRYIAIKKEEGKGKTTPLAPKSKDKQDLDEYLDSLIQAVKYGIATKKEEDELRRIMVQQRDIGHGLAGTAQERVEALERSRDAAQALLEIARKDITPTNLQVPNPGTVPGPAVSAAAEKAAASVGKVSEQMRALGEVTMDIALRAGDALVDFAMGAEDAFSNFVRSALADLGRLIARIMIVKALSSLLNSISPGAGTAFEKFAGFGGKAAGGPVMKNRPYLVGEKGPEVFMPRAAGRIIPNRTLALAGAGGITVRLDTSSLPPAPSVVSPDAVATQDWWRLAFSALRLDYKERGGLE